MFVWWYVFHFDCPKCRILPLIQTIADFDLEADVTVDVGENVDMDVEVHADMSELGC